MVRVEEITVEMKMEDLLRVFKSDDELAIGIDIHCPVFFDYSQYLLTER